MVVSLTLKSWGFFEYMVGDQFLTALAPEQKQYNACFQYKARECRVEADGYSDIASGDAMDQFYFMGHASRQIYYS